MIISPGVSPYAAWRCVSYENRDRVAAGALMSYGANVLHVYRQLGIYAARILKGDKPAEPAKFEMVVNLKTAHALGLTLPTALLLRADQLVGIGAHLHTSFAASAHGRDAVPDGPIGVISSTACGKVLISPERQSGSWCARRRIPTPLLLILGTMPASWGQCLLVEFRHQNETEAS